MPELTDLAAQFAGRLLVDDAEMAPYLVDWRNLWHGRALAIAQPDSPADVAAIMRWCAQHHVPVVAQGGNTGMSGGATPDESGMALVLSLTRLNKIRAIDPVNNTISLDAGCILATVQQAAEDAGRYFPLSLGAEGSCTIGGNLATNAGGTAVLRYGNTRELCLGLEVVTAEGERWEGMRGLRKDNSGYDLRDLFIGSEGTLGIITGAVLKLFPQPATRVTAFVALQELGAALDLLEQARRRFDSQLTGFEILSDTCLQLVTDHVPGARSPLSSSAPWYGLIELSIPAEMEGADEQFEAFLAAAFEQDLIVDGALAASVAQRQDFWLLRESISEAQGAIGKTIKHDVALPLSRIAQFLKDADAAVASRWPEVRFVTFGHLGDGNIHYNLSPAPDADQQHFLAIQDEVNAIVHDIVAGHGGTFSAEHGLGQLRRDEAARLKSSVEIALFRRIKQALDPDGILNPGKVLA